jgi:hypothetical protein
MASKVYKIYNDIGISRKDDLINMLYVMVYLLKGHLPWFPYIKKYERIMDQK